jgi:hypothetical protein
MPIPTHLRRTDAAQYDRVPEKALNSGGTVTDVNVTITGSRHTFTHDVDVQLVGPGGAQKIIVMGHSGQTATNATSYLTTPPPARSRTRRAGTEVALAEPSSLGRHSQSAERPISAQTIFRSQWKPPRSAPEV